MPDREKVIRHIVAEISIARTCKKDFAQVDIDMLSDALALLKEQDETINELQNAYGYLQKQFFEVQDKLLKEQEAETELCDRCGRRRLKSKWERR